MPKPDIDVCSNCKYLYTVVATDSAPEAYECHLYPPTRNLHHAVESGMGWMFPRVDADALGCGEFKSV